MTDRRSPAGRFTRGFTLVEVLVAVLLFGLIASIAAALTASSTRSFARTDSALAALANLEDARRLLASDLGQAARRPNLAADGTPSPAFLMLPEGFVMVRRGVSGTLPSVEKLAWGFDGGRLMRQSFPAIDGSPPGEAVVVVPQVKAVRIRVAGPKGWVDSWTPSRPEELPRAVELTLVRADGVPIVMKFLVAS